MQESQKPTHDSSMPVQSRKQNKDHDASPHGPRDTASSIFLRLPRELRNRVFTYCLQGAYDNEVIIRRAALGQTHQFIHLVREPCGQYSYQWTEDPVPTILSDKNYDQYFAREALECYYWTRTFKFAHHELCLLGPFLRTDDFGFGMTPAVYARRLQIEIQPLLFAFLLPENRALEEQRCCRALEALYSIQTPRTEIAIEVDLSQEALNDTDYERFSDAAAEFTSKIKSVVHDLQKKGLRVTLAATGSQTQNETRTSASGTNATGSMALQSLEMAIPQRGS